MGKRWILKYLEVDKNRITYVQLHKLVYIILVFRCVCVYECVYVYGSEIVSKPSSQPMTYYDLYIISLLRDGMCIDIY